MALRDSSQVEPGLMPAGVLAVLVHLIFFAFMVFGLNWKTYPPEGMVVDLWSSLPQPVQPAIKEKSAPPAPKAVEPPPEAKPVPPEPRTPPPPPKPDIAIKEKIEKPVEKKPPVQKDQKELKEKELKAQKEKELKAQKEKEKELKDQQARVAAEVAQLQREQQEASSKAQAQAAAQSRVANEMDEYKAKILAKIKRHIVMPPDLPGNPVAEFDVTLLPGGDILDVKLRKGSGFAVFDSAVERAIFLSKPLPLPPDPALFPKFRNLNLKVHYRE